MGIEYQREERHCTLSGYSGRTTEVMVELISFDRTQRMRRAWLGLAAWWAAAAATVFIPVAHFFLVPGFFAFGIYSFLQRARTAVVAVAVSGICPDCEAEQKFEAPARWSESVTLACANCGRSLKLTAPQPAV
ncbi:MAG: hypothetical protein V3T28_12005 [Gemmatimonadales bacterium]